MWPALSCWLVAQAKGVADAGSAAFRVSGLELGGLFGSLLAGRISDALIARDPKGGNCGKRVQVSPHIHPSSQSPDMHGSLVLSLYALVFTLLVISNHWVVRELLKGWRERRRV